MAACLEEGVGQGRCEGTHGQICASDIPISVGVYVVSSVGECDPTKVILKHWHSIYITTSLE